MWDARLDPGTEKKNARRTYEIQIISILYHNCFMFILNVNIKRSWVKHGQELFPIFANLH